jgi:hypothetical protein
MSDFYLRHVDEIPGFHAATGEHRCISRVGERKCYGRSDATARSGYHRHSALSLGADVHRYLDWLIHGLRSRDCSESSCALKVVGKIRAPCPRWPCLTCS